MTMSRPLRRTFTIAPAVALTLLLAACGSDDAAPVASDVATSDAAADHNDADVEFAQGMIAHHEQAIEMSEIALDPAVSAGPEVIDLATRIKAAQDPEIDLMTAWLTGWGQSVQMDMSDGHDMSSMAGMMSAEDMDALAQAAGAEFDALWLTMMIAHHEGALSQAADVTASGSSPDVLSLAAQIIATQQAEIDEMRDLLGT